jgi:hypothetical protein
MSKKTWQYHVHAVVLHAKEPRILMLPGTDGWSLPYVRLNEEEWKQELIHIRKAVHQQLGLDTVLLRCPRMTFDEDVKESDHVVVLETLGASVPIRGQWLELADLAERSLAIPNQLPEIEACLREETSGVVPRLRQPWACRGWFHSAESWIKEQLARLDITLTAPVEQLRSWGISTILVADTSAGQVYFKAIPSRLDRQSEACPFLFAHEPTLVQALATLFPDSIRMPLAIDRERAWMLTADFGRAGLPGAGIEVFEDILGRYAVLQVASASRIDELFAAGCLDRRLDVLQAQVDDLLSDAATLSQLTPQEREQLCGLGPAVRERCAELGRYELPMALVHGDLHTGNIAAQGDHYTIFDWTDACVAHPFFDLATILHSAQRFPDIPDARDRLRNAYLSRWTAYAPMERLREAADLADALGSLHQAVSYRHIVANLEAKKELDENLRDWLRGAIESLSGSPAAE